MVNLKPTFHRANVHNEKSFVKGNDCKSKVPMNGQTRMQMYNLIVIAH